jgi:preprotein translocase subunit SecD
MNRLLFLLVCLFVLGNKSKAQLPKKLQSGFYYVVTSGGQEVTKKDCKRCPAEHYLINKIPFCNMREIKEVNRDFSNQGFPVVNIQLNQKGTKILKTISKKYINKKMVLVAANKVIAVAQMMDEIKDGQIQLTGNYSVPEVDEIVKTIQSEIKTN